MSFELLNDTVAAAASATGDGGPQFDSSSSPFLHSTTYGGNATTMGNETDYYDDDVFFPLVKQPLHMVVVYSVFYGLLFVLGVLGNVMVIGVVYRNASMHTVINYFIVNMAVADLLVSLLCVPITLLNNILSAWRLGAIMCKLTPFMQGVAVNASVNTLAAISVDRYLAICFPLGHRVTRRVARIIIAAIWCSACVLLSPWAAYYEQRIYAETHLQTVYVCGQFGWPNEHVMRGYFLGVIVVSCYTLPLVLVTVCYTLIGCRVWHRDAKEIANASQEMVYRSKIRVLKMVAVVVTVFTFFWLPLYAIYVRVYFNEIDSAGLEFYIINHLLVPPAQWLALSSSSTNPIIYWLFSARFRTGYRDLIADCCCCCDKRAPRAFHSPMSSMSRHSTVRRSDITRSSATQSRYSMVSDSPTVAERAAPVPLGGAASKRTAKRAAEAYKQRLGGSSPLYRRSVSEPLNSTLQDGQPEMTKRQLSAVVKKTKSKCGLQAVSEC